MQAAKATNFFSGIDTTTIDSRCGVLVYFTAPVVLPGFDGTLTLKIINLGSAEFVLYPKMHIAQLIFEEVKGEIIPNPGQFQNQSTPEGT